MLYLKCIILFITFACKGIWALNSPSYITLNDGYKIPNLGFGTAVALSQLDVVREAVTWAIKAGFRHIDTAALYADEVMVGQALQQAICAGYVTRKEMFITTKLWNSNHARERVVPALKRSLLRLGLEYVDLFLIHSPVAEDDEGNVINIDYLETWQGMQDAKDLGLARSIGVSNFNRREISRIVNNSYTIPAVNEIEVNPTFTNTALVTFCQSLGIAVSAYSPLGFLPPRTLSNPPPPRFNDPTLVQIAKKYNKLVSQVVLRYGIDRNLIVLSRSVTLPHILSNVDIYDFSLNQKEIDTISSFNVDTRVVTLPLNSENIQQYYTDVYNPFNVTIPYDNI